VEVSPSALKRKWTEADIRHAPAHTHIEYDVEDTDPERTWVFGFALDLTLLELLILTRCTRRAGHPLHEGPPGRTEQGASSTRTAMTMRKTPSHSDLPTGPARGRQPAGGVRVDDAAVDRLVAEAEAGIPAEKLRRRGRPAMGDAAAGTFSVRLPDDLVTLVDARSELEGVTRGETIRRALVRYLTDCRP
jgi:hypothetical protein